MTKIKKKNQKKKLTKCYFTLRRYEKLGVKRIKNSNKWNKFICRLQDMENV